MLPGFWLARQAEKRKKLIANGLPDALDLLIVCVEAGMGLDQAIAKAAEELAVSHPALAEELAIITTEIRAGKPRMEAFKNFAERTKVDDVRQLVSMLVQTDRFGTSIVAGASHAGGGEPDEAPPARRGARRRSSASSSSFRSCSACFPRCSSSRSARPSSSS